MKNMSEKDITMIFNRFWIFVSFCIVAYGSSLIHIGLTWIFLGLYMFRFTLSDSGLINIFVNIPDLSELKNLENDDEDEEIDEDDMYEIDDDDFDDEQQ